MKTTLNDLDYQAKEGFEMVQYKKGSLPLFRTASGNMPWNRIIYGVISEGRYANMNVDPMYEDESVMPLWEILHSVHWILTRRLSYEITKYQNKRLNSRFSFFSD